MWMSVPNLKKSPQGVLGIVLSQEWEGQRNTDNPKNLNKSHWLYGQEEAEIFFCLLHTNRKINGAGSMDSLPCLPLFLYTFLHSDVASRKLLSRHVAQQSTIEFVISDPAVAESLSLSVSLVLPP